MGQMHEWSLRCKGVNGSLRKIEGLISEAQSYLKSTPPSDPDEKILALLSDARGAARAANVVFLKRTIISILMKTSVLGAGYRPLDNLLERALNEINS